MYEITTLGLILMMNCFELTMVSRRNPLWDKKSIIRGSFRNSK